jgi:Raf kinase inhibitor-like YbhB/YbcL family protein
MATPTQEVHDMSATPAATATAFVLESADFTEGQPIPKVHAYHGEGKNTPPRLAWRNLPKGTVELALIMDDPDAPTPEPWVHDVLYHIPVDATPDLMVLRGGSALSAQRFTAGTNSWNEPGWGGPKPPPGKPHRYFFRLYALDAHLELAPGATKAQLLAAMQGHILGTAQLMGTYRR